MVTYILNIVTLVSIQFKVQILNIDIYIIRLLYYKFGYIYHLPYQFVLSNSYTFLNICTLLLFKIH